MPTYNGERFIAAALESVREQHDDAIELVIVDDGSTDHTLDIVRDFASVLPIRLITPGRLGNWVAVSNLGLRDSRRRSGPAFFIRMTFGFRAGLRDFEQKWRARKAC